MASENEDEFFRSMLGSSPDELQIAYEVSRLERALLGSGDSSDDGNKGT